MKDGILYDPGLVDVFEHTSKLTAHPLEYLSKSASVLVCDTCL